MTDKDKRLLRIIIGYIDDLMQFTHGMAYDEFINDKKTLSASAFVISQIGEMANNISAETQECHIEIPWKSIRGMRNRIVHNYENIDCTVLWNTINNNLPVVRQQMETILP